MPDCPHQHIKDTGIDRLRSIVREQTDDGLTIVQFLVKAMDGKFPNYEPHHELEAAKILANLGSDEAAEYVRACSPSRRRRAPNRSGRSSNGAMKASDLGQSDPYLVIEPETSDIARFIREETSSGKTIVLRLIQIMQTQDDPYKPHHNLAAAKELLNRGWAMPNAVECSWLCGHHVPAQYFNGHKPQDPVLSQSNGANAHAATQDTKDSGPSASGASPELAEESKANTAATALEATPEPSRRAGFTDLDVLPEHYWSSVLELCERLEEKGSIPQLPLADDDPLPNICSIKIANCPEVDLTDDDVAEKFWERVAEQIEIQEDWSEMWRYRPRRGLNSDGIFVLRKALEETRRQSLPPPDS